MNVFACAFADVRNATAAAEYAALQRATRQRVTRARVHVCVCMCTCESVSVYIRAVYAIDVARVCVCVCFCEPRASVYASGAGGKYRGRDARRRCVPNFTAEKLDAAPLRSHPEVRASIRNADRDVVPRRGEAVLRSASLPFPPRPFPCRPFAFAWGKILKASRGETWKKRRGRGDSDPRGNISRITSARFVGEILITFPRHRGGKVCV